MVTSRLILLFTLCSLLWLRTANAETYYPLISYQCDTTADIIKITNSLLPAEKARDFNYSSAEGTYSPWKMVDIETINGTSVITHTREITNNCKLSSGEYMVKLEPQVFSKELTGNCGDSISAAVSVELNGVEIQERLPFEDFCLGNAPVITQVTVLGKTSQVKIKRIPKYRFY